MAQHLHLRVNNRELERLIIADRTGEPVRDSLYVMITRSVEAIYASVHNELSGEREDLLQEGLLAVVSKIGQWRPERGTAYSFVQRVAQNRMRDLSRANRRRGRATRQLLQSVERDPIVRRRLAC